MSGGDGLWCRATDGNNREDTDNRNDRVSNGQSDARERPQSGPGWSNTSSNGFKHRYNSSRPSRIEVAAEKGDYKLVSELSRRELTLEDYIGGYVDYTRRLKHPSAGDMDTMAAYKSKHFSKPLTCQELGMEPYELEDFLDSVRTKLGLTNGSSVEQAIDGYIRLWRKLGKPEQPDWDWMSAYHRSGFNRQATAKELEVRFTAFEKRLTRLRQRLKIKARSVRTKQAD